MPRLLREPPEPPLPPQALRWIWFTPAGTVNCWLTVSQPKVRDCGAAEADATGTSDTIPNASASARRRYLRNKGTPGDGRIGAGKTARRETAPANRRPAQRQSRRRAPTGGRLSECGRAAVGGRRSGTDEWSWPLPSHPRARRYRRLLRRHFTDMAVMSRSSAWLRSPGEGPRQARPRHQELR